MNREESAPAPISSYDDGVTVSLNEETHRSKHNALQKGERLDSSPFCGDGHNDCPFGSWGSIRHGVFGRRSEPTAERMTGTRRARCGPNDRNRRSQRPPVHRMYEITDGGRGDRR